MNQNNNERLHNRYQGAMLGLAVGDALGTTLEFEIPGSFEPIDDMVGGGIFGLRPGQWTDDTSMALCLAQSLVEQKTFDPDDQMQRYLRWIHDGYLSSTGECFDIGTTIREAMCQYERDNNTFAGKTADKYGGNGSLMRLAPIPLAYAKDPMRAIHLAGEMSRTTHGAREPVDACRYYAGLIVGALQGCTKDQLLSGHFSPYPGAWQSEELVSNISEIAAGSFKYKQPPEIKGTGYVVKALEAALWAFWNTEDFEKGALAAVNLGNDADTTGAIFGQLAGAYYGVDAIPERWRNKISMSEKIIELADGLFELSKGV